MAQERSPRTAMLAPFVGPFHPGGGRACRPCADAVAPGPGWGGEALPAGLPPFGKGGRGGIYPAWHALKSPNPPL